MEQESAGGHESDPSPSRGEAAGEDGGPLAASEVGNGTGEAERFAREGAPGGRREVARGAEETEAENPAVDAWTACLAKALAALTASAPGESAASGAVYKPGLEPELLAFAASSTQEARRLFGSLTKYGLGSGGHRQVEQWLEDIAAQDQAEAQRVLKEELIPALAALYGVKLGEHSSRAADLTWLGLLRRNKRLGGWALHGQAGDSSRRVFEAAPSVKGTEPQEMPQIYRQPKRKRRRRRYGLLESIFMPIPDEFL